MHARADGVTSGSVWSDIQAVGTDGNNLPEKVMFRNIQTGSGNDEIVSINTSVGYVRAETYNGSGRARLNADNNNYIDLSPNNNTIMIDGKKGLTGTYTVTKSVTTRAGLVVGVE